MFIPGAVKITGRDLELLILAPSSRRGPHGPNLSHHPAYGSRTRAVPEVNSSEFIQLIKH